VDFQRGNARAVAECARCSWMGRSAIYDGYGHVIRLHEQPQRVLERDLAGLRHRSESGSASTIRSFRFAATLRRQPIARAA
jgi:hypothetical protein